MWVRYNRLAVTCPWEVWTDREFVTAHQTWAEAVRVVRESKNEYLGLMFRGSKV